MRSIFKNNKYAHFVIDISEYKINVTAFEVGSRGYISPANKKRLGMLQKFLNAGNPLSKFKKNVTALSVYSFYYIFLSRKDPAWSEPNFLAAPFV